MGERGQDWDIPVGAKHDDKDDSTGRARKKEAEVLFTIVPVLLLSSCLPRNIT